MMIGSAGNRTISSFLTWRWKVTLESVDTFCPGAGFRYAVTTSLTPCRSFGYLPAALDWANPGRLAVGTAEVFRFLRAMARVCIGGVEI